MALFNWLTFTASLKAEPAATLLMTMSPALMPVVLSITTPPTVTWSNATLGVVAMLMALPTWLMAMF